MSGPTLVAVILVVLGLAGQVLGDILVRKENETITYFDDMMSMFGPSISSKGVRGYVYVASPLDGCSAVQPPPIKNLSWIALIARDNCSFVEKVRKAQNANYSAAIVYNSYSDDDVLSMAGDGSDIIIPSVFVGWTDGELLRTQYCFNCLNLEHKSGTYNLFIDNHEPQYYNPYVLWPFAAVVGTCFILMIIFMVIKWCRDINRRRKSRLPKKQLKKIPTKKFKKGDEYDCCAICLDDYEEGDKLRLLPCSHAYHTKCIDPWLTKNKRSCPICKRKVFPGDDPDTESDSSDDERPTERTPLLGNSSEPSGQTNRRSTFDSSGLPPPTGVVRVNPGHTCSHDSDQSESEEGAAGGVRHLNLGQENPLLSLGRAPVHEKRPANQKVGSEEKLTNENQAAPSSSTYQDKHETVVTVTNEGADNSGFRNDDFSSEEEDGDFGNPGDADDVMYVGKGKVDEKKNNGVV
ncbi:E3 ubiquitin-protein ligase RNF13-like isoform X1 [Mya arenaria]|uniref:E3 ubiquitin-protein ligase RNF13-like isoform X1 n=1 Tax=Mya arenaria TaxID=6604 RepID=UPI0022E26BE7|nr:E3 ubiquitin-protein ligase RNF13-like isoform X1 [Mya arenaria]